MNNGKVSKSKINTRTLVQGAVLVAISIVLSRVGTIMITPQLKLGFGETPLMIAGFLFGPFIGGISGLVADLIGFLLNSYGAPWHPGFTISSVMWGVIPGLFAMYFRKIGDRADIFSLGKVSVAVTTSMIIVSLGMNSFWLFTLYGKALIGMIPGRILNFLVSTPIQSYIITKLIKVLRPMTELK